MDDKQLKETLIKIEKLRAEVSATYFPQMATNPLNAEIHSADSREAYFRATYDNSAHQVNFYACQRIPEFDTGTATIAEQTALIAGLSGANFPYDDQAQDHDHANNAGTRARVKATLIQIAKNYNYVVKVDT